MTAEDGERGKQLRAMECQCQKHL